MAILHRGFDSRFLYIPMNYLKKYFQIIKLKLYYIFKLSEKL